MTEPVDTEATECPSCGLKEEDDTRVGYWRWWIGEAADFGACKRCGWTEARSELATSRAECIEVRKALGRAIRIGALMSNVCWSLGRPDRKVGDRSVLTKIADRWDEFRSGIKHLFPGAKSNGD